MGVTRRPTIRTVAAQAEVSVATVSYVLSGRAGGKSRVSPATRARVLAAAGELGYQANQQARSVRRGRSDQVCLVLDRLDTPWAQALVHEVVAAVGPAGYTTLVLVGGTWSTFLQAGGADGAVIDGLVDPGAATPVLAELAARGVSLVVHHGTMSSDGFDVVRPDEAPACQEAMAHLVAGHTRIACLRGDPPSDEVHAPPNPRYAAYVQALAGAGLPADPALERFTHTSRARAYRAALDLLDRPDRPTAIFALSDLAALGALDAARRLGLAVPEQLEVIGVGNTPDALEADPPLSSIGPESSFPAGLAHLLLRRLQGEDDPPPGVHPSPWRWHQRGTTRS